jgi:hypothetical protein
VPINREREFTPFTELQRRFHCGPSALTSCLFMLGTETNQDLIVKKSGLSRRYVKCKGMDEKELIKVAKMYGVITKEISEEQEREGTVFMAHLRDHLIRGLPALLLTLDFMHWVALVAFQNDCFVIVDPLDKTRIFDTWSSQQFLQRAWNSADGVADGVSQFCALLLRRKDNQSPRWKFSPAWLDLCTRGAHDTAMRMRKDLLEVLKCCGAHKRSCDVSLSNFIQQQQSTIVATVSHWGEGCGKYSTADLSACLYDYSVVAAAANLQFSRETDERVLMTHITALLGTYWWGGIF